jgi:hypothetical protein
MATYMTIRIIQLHTGHIHSRRLDGGCTLIAKDGKCEVGVEVRVSRGITTRWPERYKKRAKWLVSTGERGKGEGRGLTEL